MSMPQNAVTTIRYTAARQWSGGHIGRRAEIKRRHSERSAAEPKSLVAQCDRYAAGH